MEHSYFNDILILFVAAVVIVVLCLRMRLPPVLGYLLVGILVGPYGLALIGDAERTRALAEFGVVFLLFTIGLEFSLPLLMRMKASVLGLGLSQVVLTTAVTVIIALLFDFPLEGAVILGGVVTMSSTALVIKQLSDQVELHTRHGRNAVGILLFQDIMVIPFLVLIASLGTESADTLPVAEVLIALTQGFIALVIILAIGHWVLRPMFRGVAHFQSTELFTLTVLLVSLGAAWITHQWGLSLALGAFIAGMMLGETEFRHQIEAEIRPFRDILLGLFFITIGMLLNIRLLPQIWVEVVLVLALLVLFKMLLVFGICRIAGWNKAVSLRTGLVLAQGGEFSFAILALALSGNVIAPEHGQIILAALFISMALAPVLIHLNGRIAAKIMPETYTLSMKEIKDQVAHAAHGLSNHVILCGYGRVGQNVARALVDEGFKYIALELDPKVVQEAIERKEPVSYGDAANIHMLKAAGLSNAVALVVSIDDINASLKILHKVRAVNKQIPILVRAADDSQLEKLLEAGATEVVPEILEESLMLSSQLLLMLKVPATEVFHKARMIRDSRYQILRELYPGQTNEDLKLAIGGREQLRMVEVPDAAWYVDKGISELGLEDSGAAAIAILRHGKVLSSLDAEPRLMIGDSLVLYGTEVSLNKAVEMLSNRAE